MWQCHFHLVIHVDLARRVCLPIRHSSAQHHRWPDLRRFKPGRTPVLSQGVAQRSPPEWFELALRMGGSSRGSKRGPAPGGGASRLRFACDAAFNPFRDAIVERKKHHDERDGSYPPRGGLCSAHGEGRIPLR